MMASTGSNKHKRRAPEAGASQRLLDSGPVQNLKLKERQRLSEDGERPPSAHLQVDCRKPPMGSISSMEVNVDLLEQMDLMDLMDVSDHEALDVFLSEGARVSPPDAEEEEEEEEEDGVHRERAPGRRQPEVSCGSRRSFSTSSGCSDTSAGGAETPVIQSDDEEVHADNVLLTSVPQSRDQETDEEDEAGRCSQSV
ncbi:dysbindin-like [Betta splendens]|uniref:Dysbindin-like n=1 Tax=Betta splendens TaxID=158456 RepID=A0A6P7MWI3_BETSP|nr:dysbindin-like [Betta splendens]